MLARLPGHLWPFGLGKGQHVLTGVARPRAPRGELSSDSMLGTWLLGGAQGFLSHTPIP